MTVGETCSPTRESTHEGYATTHDCRNGASTFKRWEDNGREWMEGLNSGEAYKKVANEGKMVRIFDIETKIKRALNTRYHK